MDSRDKDAAVAEAVAASPPPDEDGMVSDTVAMAKDAAVMFQSQRYSDCLELLNQILQKKEGDPKVLHNIAITEYYRVGCSAPTVLLDVLKQVKKKSEDLARASGEQMEASNTPGSNAVFGSRGINANLGPFCGANVHTLPYADEFDTSVALLNTAVILYQFVEYAKAMAVLEPLYHNIEPLDEATALHVCLLMLDCALACHDASKASDVFQYMEKSSGLGLIANQGDSSTIAQNFPSHGVKASAAANNMVAPDISGSDCSAGLNAPDDSLGRAFSDDGLEYENFISSLDSGAPALSKTSYGDSTKATTMATDLKLKLHLYKVRLLLLTRNLKAAKREAKLAMNVARGGDSSAALLVKSQLEYARGNHQKAIKLLLACGNRSEATAASMFDNNLGCIYYHLGQYHTSGLFFSRALQNCAALRSERPPKLATFSQDKFFIITYNCGLQHLACGKPLHAARCFHKAGKLFYDKPVLWLRLAECCFSAAEKGLLKTDGVSSGNEKVKGRVVGSGYWRNIMLDFDFRNKNSGLLGADRESVPDNGVKLSLPFARKCLLNARHLIDRSEPDMLKSNAAATEVKVDGDSDIMVSGGMTDSGHENVSSVDPKGSGATLALSQVSSGNDDLREPKGGSSLNPAMQSSVAAYEDSCRREKHTMKQAVLADLAYVELCLENPYSALSASRALMELQDCLRIFSFLGHVYAAEALCLLGRTVEAAELLAFYFTEDGSVKLPYSDEDDLNWRIEKEVECEEFSSSASLMVGSMRPEQSRAVLCADLAAMAALQRNHDQANRLDKEAFPSLPNNSRTLLATVYFDIVRGMTQDALMKLKEHRHVHFLGSGRSRAGFAGLALVSPNES